MEFFINNIVYVALFLTVLTFVFLFLKNNKNTNKSDSVSHNLSVNEVEIKLRAYERLAIFLDRIEPVGMVNRLELHNLNIDLVKSALIKNIVIEYEYNISQQIYISDELWTIVELVKNKIINNISSSSESLSKKANTDDLVQKMLENSKQNNLIIRRAQKFLKKEVRRIS